MPSNGKWTEVQSMVSWSAWGKYSKAFRYGMALLAVGLAVGARSAFFAYFQAASPIYIFFWPAIIFSAACLGLGPSLVSLVFSALVISYWLEPANTFVIASTSQAVGMALFVLNNLLIIWIFAVRRHVDDRIREAELSKTKSEAIAEQTKALQASEERFRYILKHTPNAIVVCDNEMRYLMVSDRFLRDYHLSDEEVIGRSHYEIFPEIPQRWKDVHERCLHGAVERAEEDPFVRTDGTTEWVRWECRPLYLADGAIGGIIIYTEVITERKQAQEDLKRAKEEAEAANRAKDHFLAILSHELRTPLTPALMSVSARESDPKLSDELREDMATIRRNLELEARLIDDLLDLNRMARGKIELHHQSCDLNESLRNVLDICRDEIEGKGQMLRMELTAESHDVNGDAGRLQQVFWNLLKNATKFTPQGGIITVRCFNPCVGTVRVEVADTGIGISPEVLPHLFVAFEQGGLQVPQQFGGLGLGLAICKAMVDLHGGRIFAQSEGLGKGTVFVVELPVIQIAEMAVPAQKSAPSSGDSAAGTPKSGVRSPRILLVEDNADTLRILSRSLEREGCSVVPARDVGSAMAAARTARIGKERFDLLISDLGLPDGDGRDIMRQLHALDGLPGIAISGYGMEEDIERSHSAGFSAHLTKPVQFDDIRTEISRLLPDLLHRA